VRRPVFIGDFSVLVRRQRILDEDALVEGEELDSKPSLAESRMPSLPFKQFTSRRRTDQPMRRPSFEKVLRPAIVEDLKILSRQQSSTMLSSPRRPSNTMRILSSAEKMPPRRAADVLHKLFRRLLRQPGFLGHRHSAMVTMSQKPSVLQPAKSVSQALTPDMFHAFKRRQSLFELRLRPKVWQT
jgi:hypothetical protein